MDQPTLIAAVAKVLEPDARIRALFLAGIRLSVTSFRSGPEDMERAAAALLAAHAAAGG